MNKVRKVVKAQPDKYDADTNDKCMARATRASSPAARSLTHGPDGTTNPLHGAEPHKLLVEAAAARRQIQTRRAPNVRVRQHATVSEKPPRAHRQWTEARRRPGPYGGSARGVPAVSREPAHGSSLNPPRAPRRAGALDRTGAARRADEKRRRRRPRSQNRRARFGAPAPWTVRGLRSRSARGLKRARPRLKSDPPQGARGQRIPPIGTVVFFSFFSTVAKTSREHDAGRATLDRRQAHASQHGTDARCQSRR